MSDETFIDEGLRYCKPGTEVPQRDIDDAQLRLDRYVRKYSNGNVDTEKMIMTPALARALLARNQNNRPFKNDFIRDYEADMMHGDFKGLNGQTIVVSKEGLLNDGQNRCIATINTKTNWETIFVFGAERESRMTLDSGAVRTAGNYLAMEGIENAHALAPVAKFLIMYEIDPKEGLFARGRAVEMRDSTTKQGLLKYVRAHHDELQEAVEMVKAGVDQRALGSIPNFTAAHAIVRRSAPHHEADFFLRQVLNGENLTKNSPAMMLRRRYMAARLEEAQLRQGPFIELYIRAWNMHARGEAKSFLRILKTIPKVLSGVQTTDE